MQTEYDDIKPAIYLAAAERLASGLCPSGCCMALNEVTDCTYDFMNHSRLFDYYFEEYVEISLTGMYYFGRTLTHVNEMHEDPMDDKLFADALNHRLMALAMMAAIVEDPE